MTMKKLVSSLLALTLVWYTAGLAYAVTVQDTGGRCGNPFVIDLVAELGAAALPPQECPPPPIIPPCEDEELLYLCGWDMVEANGCLYGMCVETCPVWLWFMCDCEE